MRDKLRNDQVRRIVITGPESTGKSTLASCLADHYNTFFVPEYARDYILSLRRPYRYEDIEKIALWQLRKGKELLSGANNYLFLDTYLVVTKIWFLFHAKTYPGWIDDELQAKNIDLFLICDYDLPWVPDPVRENGGEMRRILFNVYRAEIEYYGIPYRIVSGRGEARFVNACRAVDSFFSNHKDLNSQT